MAMAAMISSFLDIASSWKRVIKKRVLSTLNDSLSQCFLKQVRTVDRNDLLCKKGNTGGDGFAV
jgi:hypothetical protein